MYIGIDARYVVEVFGVIDARDLGELRGVRREKQDECGDDNRTEGDDRSGADRCHITPRTLTAPGTMTTAAEILNAQQVTYHDRPAFTRGHLPRRLNSSLRTLATIPTLDCSGIRSARG